MSAQVTVPEILSAKESGRRLAMVTAYDCTFASLIDRAGVDILLVGDSLGMVVQGESSTLPVTLEEMVYHTRLVARANTHALVLGDMPFGSYLTVDDTLTNAGKFLKAGAGAVKLEGGVAQAEKIRALVNAEIPVVGHVGLTPQAMHRMGGHRVQGRDNASRQKVLEDARAVAEAGAFAMVIEGVPLDLARQITETVDIPTIGIGAGPHCDGQVLVMHDLLGIDTGDRKAPRFVRRYANLGQQITDAVETYVDEVRTGAFPSDEECYHVKGNPERAGDRLTQISKIDEMRTWSARQRGAGLKVSFVPTMGFLHEGHLSLVRQARERGDRVVVSIFVNPIQFDREDDLVSYPRDLERDQRLLAQEGVDVLFTPDPRAMYSDDFVTTVDVERLTDDLCGAHRAGHFRGVTTVVSKLFHAVQPDVAVFGRKDYQQLAVVRRMARDLDFGIEVVGGETVREGDGLALSSRNARLDSASRAAAICVPQALDTARLAVADGVHDAAGVERAVRRALSHVPGATLEYARVVDPESLEAVAHIERPVQLAVAVWLGGVRLIDNVRIDPAQGSPELIAQTANTAPAASSHDVPAAALYAKSSDR